MKLHKVKINFTQISNNIFSDDRLSAKAKGIYCYLFSKPDDWDYSSPRISKEFKDSRKTIDSGLRELEAIGYLKRIKNSNGKMDYLLDIKANLSPVDKKGNEQKQQGAKIDHISNTENKVILKEKNNSIINNNETEVSYGKKEINDILLYLCKTIGIDEFKETKKLQRWYGKIFYNYINKVGKEDFIMRFKGILQDDFKSKNCNSIKYLYNEIKSFIHTPNIEPKKKAGAHFII